MQLLYARAYHQRGEDIFVKVWNFYEIPSTELKVLN